MASKGETVKYIIEADTSGFNRGMAEATIASDIAGKKISNNLGGTAKQTENNFRDMRNSAKYTSGSIRAFGTSLQGFTTTSIVLGITALSGAVLELAGAAVAASSTATLLAPALVQGGSAALAFKTGMSGLSDAFAAVMKNDPVAFRQSLVALGPAATSVAYAFGGLNKAFNSVKLNTQQALLKGVGTTLLQLGALILPTVNAGFQLIGRSMNSAFSQAAALASQPIFSGLLATIFSDTAKNIGILAGGLAPLLSIFTNLYLVTRPYVSLLSQLAVNMLTTLAAYLSTTRGQAGLNLAIQEGLVAIGQLGSLAGAVFKFLQAIFNTSVNSGINFITTLAGIINNMTAWVNSAKGQQDLISLFNFTSIALQTVASAAGIALKGFFEILNVVSALAPTVQRLFIGFLSLLLAIVPVGGYFLGLYAAVKTVAIGVFNLSEQLFVVFAALGGVASIALILAGGLIVLGSVIGGPLGSALIVIGVAIAAFVGLNYLLGQAAVKATGAMLAQGSAALYTAQTEGVLAGMDGLLAVTMLDIAASADAAGVGMSLAAKGAQILQASLIPLLVLAAGIAVIIGMLGLFNGKGQQTQTTSNGLGSSLGALQKQMQGVGAVGNKASTGGLAALNDSLNNVGNASAAAQGSLASFDKMNVLSPSGTGIPGLPSLPDMGNSSLGAPTLDTGAFDKSLADMQKNFNGLKSQLATGIPNPFAEIGKWIDAHPWIALAGFGVVLGIITAVFVIFGVAAVAAAIGVSLTIGLIVVAVIAVVAIIILLAQNWGTVMSAIQGALSVTASFIQTVWNGIFTFISGIITNIGSFFVTAFNAIVAFLQQWGIVILAALFGPIALAIVLYLKFRDQVNAAFQSIVDFLVGVFTPVVAFFATIFTNAWNAIVLAFSLYVTFFSGIWTGIMAIFAGVGGWFGSIFAGAWNAIKSAFSAVVGFFQGLWNSIVGIFGSVGTSVGNAIAGAVRNVLTSVVSGAVNIVNGFLNSINGAIDLIRKLPGLGSIGKLGLLTVPHFATGGVVTKSTIANIGENGAEAVMPLQNNTGWIDSLADKINAANGSGKGGQPIQITVQIGEDKITSKIIDLINEKTQMSGRNSILI